MGRPILYGTTDDFLKQFGFETLKELPDIGDIEGMGDNEEQEMMDVSEVYQQQIAISIPEKR